MNLYHMHDIPSSSPAKAAETLGPIINCFLHRLDATLGACSPSDTRVLMALRAGLRIEDLYALWRETRQTPKGPERILFPSSRMLAIKAAYKAQRNLALGTLWEETQHATTETLLRALLNSEFRSGRIDEDALGAVPNIPLHTFLDQDTPGARLVSGYLTEQSERFERYLENVANGADRLVFVDSGWKGTSQMLFEAAFPQYTWEGIYFGTSGRSSVAGFQPTTMHAMIFDSTTLRDEAPETAFLVHRHVIESLFEPGIASIETLTQEDMGQTLCVEDLLVNEVADPWDAAYEAVKDYLRAHANDPMVKMTADYEVAVARIAEILTHPKAEDVTVYSGKARSFDLGRTGSITSFYPTEDRGPWDSPDLRIKQSIWQTGQIALEFEGEKARKQQAAIVAPMKPAPKGSYFSGKAQDAADMPGTHVAIITRTKNRPLLLRRAAASVAASTHTDYTWVVVNDGGDPAEVMEVIDNSMVDPSRIVVCHNSQSLGMEAASNVGIQATGSDFIVIHDDDDSWEPRFLEETVAFLRANASIYKGVITGTTYVSEEITETEVIEYERKPYQDWIRNIQLTEMAAGNYFAPIAFLFRRDAYDDIGGFDENLPVLGDWDFNIRFLIKNDIGVLPVPLANYHHRDRVNSASTYSNSVIGGNDRHAQYTSIMRNKYFRLAAKDPAFSAVATLMGGGYFQDDLRNRLSSVREQIIGATMNSRQESELNSRLKAALGDSLRLIASLSAEPLTAQQQDAIRAHIPPATSFDSVADVDAVTRALFAVGRLQPADPPPVTKPKASAPEPTQQSPSAPLEASASWMTGAFNDGWVDHKSSISVKGTQSVKLTVWLPASENDSDKLLEISLSDDLLGSFEISRGKATTITFDVPEGTNGLIDLVCGYPERPKNEEVRLLGFVCLDLKAA
jgi:glycosyltransferase involved in cell wall biosynthesis